MGWTSSAAWTNKELLKQAIEKDLRGVAEILDRAVVGRAGYYLVRRPGRPSEILVVLMEKGPKEKCWAYKDIPECMGPSEKECPKRLLDAVDPSKDAGAIEWRKDCRETAERGRQTFAIGDLVDVFGTRYVVGVPYKDGYFIRTPEGQGPWRVSPKDMVRVKV